jgi:Ca-activated chloride channel homolog
MRKFFKHIVIVLVLFAVTQVSAQNWRSYFELGKILYEKNDFQNAYVAFKKAQELAPNPEQLDAHVAQSAYRAGQFDEASAAYKRMQQNNNDTWSNYNEGNAHFRNENYADAIEAYKNALRKDPTNDVARYNLAQAMKKQQEQEQQNQNQDNQNDQNQDNQNQNNQNQDNQKQDNQNQDNQGNPNNQNQKPEDRSQDSEANKQSRLSREESDKLLESMQQADKKTQEKLKDKDKRTVGGGKREKDW